MSLAPVVVVVVVVVVVYLVNLKVPNTLSKSVKHKSKVHGIDAKRLPPRQQ
jgi:NADH:ubiquinone oxidoreductase subunit 3 (subunit A)